MDRPKGNNACRICLSQNLEDCESVYLLKLNESEWLLSEIGNLYEDLFNIPIATSVHSREMRFVCNSCALQMKLFNKLKTKALESSQFLQNTGVAPKVEEEDQVKIEEAGDFHLECDVMSELFPEDYGEQEDYLEDTQENIQYLESEGLSHEKMWDVDPNEFAKESDSHDQSRSEIEYLQFSDSDKEGDVATEEQENELNERYSSNSGNVVNLDGESQDQLTEIEYLDDQISIDSDTNQTQPNDLRVELDNVLNQEDVKSPSEKEKTKRKNKKHETKEKSYTCPQCEQAFPNKTQLNSHRREYHNKKPLHCPSCNKRLFSEEALQAHLNVHRGLPAYTCTVCNKNFNQKFHLEYHMHSHRNERNLKCEFCNKAFLSKGDLGVHMRAHNDERRYSCDVCGRAFRQSTHMRNHRYTHFEKQFECPHCSQKYMTPYILSTHIKSVHCGEMPFHCGECGKRFKRKHHLTSHLKHHEKPTFTHNLTIATEDEYYEQVMAES